MRLCALLIVSTALAQDPADIVRRSIVADDASSKLARNYTYEERQVVHELDGKGNIKATHAVTRDVIYIGGRRYNRLTGKDGRPLTPQEEKTAQARLDRRIAEHNRESEAERRKHAATAEKRRAEEREQKQAIPEAFNLKLLGQEQLAGRTAWVIEATPRPGYHGPHAGMLSKMQGKLWIDTGDYHWAKVEAETLDTISFGLFIARLGKGTHLEFEQVRVNDEVWLPKRAAFAASARLGLIKKFNLDQETVWSNYRKFQTDSHLTSATELEPTPKPK